MQGTVTTLDEVALDGARDLRRLLLQIGPGLVAATALAVGVGLWGLPKLLPTGPDLADRPAVAPVIVSAASPTQPRLPFGALTPFKATPAAAPSAAPTSVAIAANPFGALVSDRSFFLTAGPAVAAIAQ